MVRYSYRTRWIYAIRDCVSQDPPWQASSHRITVSACSTVVDPAGTWGHWGQVPYMTPQFYSRLSPRWHLYLPTCSLPSLRGNHSKKDAREVRRNREHGIQHHIANQCHLHGSQRPTRDRWARWEVIQWFLDRRSCSHCDWNHNIFRSYLRCWIPRLPQEHTWTNFVDHFISAHNDLRETNPSVDELGYQSAKAIVAQIVEQIRAWTETHNNPPHPPYNLPQNY